MITLIVLIVLFFGIKVKFGFNYKAKTLVFNIILFNRFYILNFRLFVSNGIFYYSINHSIPKEFKIKNEITKIKINVKKIKLYNGKAFVYLSDDDIITLNSVGAIFNMFFEYLKHSNKFDFNDFNGDISLNINDFDILLFFEFTIKFTLLKIILLILHTFIIDKLYRRKYAVKSNRRTHGINA